jgi:hypothetical protein
MTEELMPKKKDDPDAIYRYLGFGINPGKIKEFWDTEEEKKKYTKKVQARGARLSTLERETSTRNMNLMTTVDKTFSLIGGLILIAAFFFPIYSIDPEGKAISGSGISFLINLPFIGSYASGGGIIMILALVVFSLILLTCPVAGVLNILGLFNKNTGDKYLETVKKYSRFTFVPILLYVLLLVILIIGAPHPFGSLGIDALGDHLGFGAIFTLTSYGFWLYIVGLLFGFAQSRGI